MGGNRVLKSSTSMEHLIVAFEKVRFINVPAVGIGPFFILFGMFVILSRVLRPEIVPE